MSSDHGCWSPENPDCIITRACDLVDRMVFEGLAHWEGETLVEHIRYADHPEIHTVGDDT